MADEDADGGFIVVHGDGYGNPSAGTRMFFRLGRLLVNLHSCEPNVRNCTAYPHSIKIPTGPTGFGSWNCSRSDGPFGPPCVVPRPEGHELPCYDTCPQCDPVNTCDWSACLDDVVFVRDTTFLELHGLIGKISLF